MSDPSKPLAPIYRRDLQTLVSRAFAVPAPIPNWRPPGGSLSSRIGGDLSSTGDLVALGGDADAADTEARSLTPEEYWPLVLPHRVLILGPLLDIASSGLPRARMLAAEQRLLSAYHEVYDAVPLPLDLLKLLQQHQASGEDTLLDWLDQVTDSLMSAPTLDLLRETRSSSRLEVLRRLASWSWSECAGCVAELTIDIATLCRAVAMDVETAESLAEAHDGSVALAVRALDEEQALKFEEILPSLTTSAVQTDQLTREERPWIEMLMAGREPSWKQGLLTSPEEPGVRRVDAFAEKPGTHVSDPRIAKATEEQEFDRPAVSGAELFRGIVEKLERRILGRPQLCRELGLAGTAHLQGVTGQRLLLCGPTGSGKSHAAEALAQAIGRPHLFVSVSDLTTTGFRGAEINDLIQALDARCKRTGPGVLILDESDKARIIEGSTDNSRSAQTGLIVSLMNLLDGRPATPDNSRGEQIDTAPILIIGTGAFEDRFTARPPSTTELVSWGWTREFAARWGQRICLTPVSRHEAFELLKGSGRTPDQRLRPLLDALDLEILLPDHLVWYAVDRWMSAGCDYRTAAEWLLAATRARIIQHLESDGRLGATLELTPDDLPFTHGRNP